MGGLFNIEGPFYKFGSVLWDIMALSFLWIIFSLPVVTVGASTSALYYITTRRISKKEGYLFKDFLESFKNNFKQATKVWLLILLVGIILTVNISVILFNPALLNMSATMLIILLPLQLMLLLELVFFMLYVFPIIARFEIRGKTLFKTTLLMIHKHLPTTLLLTLMFAIILVAIFWYLNGLVLLFASGIYSYGASFFFMKIFKKYRPEMDKDPDDLEAAAL